MEQYDYDTEESLRVASSLRDAQRNDDGDSAAGSTSRGDLESNASTRRDRDDGDAIGELDLSDSGNASTASSVRTVNSTVDGAPHTHMTINTRRRLIRKPLPSIPGQRSVAGQAKPIADLSLSSSSSSQSTSTTTSHSHAASVKEDTRAGTLPQSALFARNGSPHRHAITLEQAQKRTADIAQNERAMMEWWPNLDEAEGAGGAGGISAASRTARLAMEEQTAALPGTERSSLSAQCQTHLTRLVEACLVSTKQFDVAESVRLGKVIVPALQQSLDSLSTAEAMSALQQTSSVLWRVDALVRSNDQLSGAKGGLGALLGVLGVRWPRLVPWRGKEGGTNDAGTLSLSNSFGLPVAHTRPAFLSDMRSVSNASNVTMGTEQRRRKRDVAMQLLNNAFWMSGGVGALDDPSHFLAGNVDHPALCKNEPSAQAEAVKKRSGGAPNLLSKPVAPIVALAGSITTNDSSTNPKSGDESMSATDAKTDSTTPALAAPASTGDGTSMLTDRLTQQLRTATRTGSEVTAHEGEGRERHTLSRMSSQASLSSTSAAGQASVPRVKISICKVCVRFEDEWDRAVASRMQTRRRSDTVTGGTLKGDKTARQRREEGATDASVTSDRTIRSLLGGADAAATAVAIDWKAKDFDGKALHLNPLSTDIEGRDFDDGNDGVNVIGGTFAIRGVEEEASQDAIFNTLDVGLYAALAMFLESSCLADFDVTPKMRQEDEKRDDNLPTSSDSSSPGSPAEEPPSPAAGSQKEESNSSVDGDVASARRSRGIWGLFHTPGADAHRGRSALPRTSTMETVTQRKEKVISVAQYGRLGKIISSIAGNTHKRPLSSVEDQQGAPDGRPRAQSDVGVQPAQENASEPQDEKTPAWLGPAPLFISPYRAKHSKEVVDNSLPDIHYMEELVSRQSLSLMVTEGLDLTLPFAQTAKSVNTTPLPSPALSAGSRGEGRGSAFFSSQAGLPATQSRLSAATRDTSASAQSDQTKASAASNSAPRFNSSTEDAERHRREVLFYQRGGSCRDTSLGQAVEEMAAKAVVLHDTYKNTERAKKEKPAAKDASSRTFKIAQYIHGQNKISICACTLKPKPTSTSASAKVSEAPTPTTSDAKQVAQALQTDQDLAKTALQLAEHIEATKQAGGKPAPTAKATLDEGRPTAANASIEMWHADMRTGRQSVARVMSYATYLASFGTFLEALMESTSFTRESPDLLGVDESDKDALDGTDDPKHDLVRLFKVGNVVLKFHVQSITIYDLLIEGPVVIVNNGPTGEEAATGKARDDKLRDTLSRSLIAETRREIQSFFASVKEEISRLDHVFVARELDNFGNTIKPPVEPASKYGSVRSMLSADDMDTTSESQYSLTESERSGYSGAAAGPLELLAKVLASVRKAEFDLYESLKEAEVGSLNDVRHRLYDRAKSAKNRLSAWSHKHLTKTELEQFGAMHFDEPYYFHRGNHAFPGSHYVLRQDEPLSIIAYSLSSRDFNLEMTTSHRHQHQQHHPSTADVLGWRSSVVGIPGAKDGNAATSLMSSSYKSNSSAASITSSNDTGHLDPDEDEDFSVQEPLHVKLKRKKRTKDIGILSLRIRSNVYSAATPDTIEERAMSADSSTDTAKVERASKKDTPTVAITASDANSASGDEDTSTPTGSRLQSSAASLAPSSASRFSTVSSNNDTFCAHVSTLSPRNALGNMFAEQDLTSTDTVLQRGSGLSRPMSVLSSSVGSAGSAATIGEESAQRTPTLGQSARMPERSAVDGLPGGDQRPSSSMQSVGDTPKPRLASTGAPASPHIKQTLLTGNVKISCVSWFAEDFSKLRKTWNVEEDFVASLSRSKTWSNVGGKSKSGFYMTQDGRWIAKQLLNVWTVDEKEAFLEFAPAYLRYMMNSVVNDCPTLLVKIAGVYSLKIKDVKTGELKLKLSVQVLENVFAGDGGHSIRFDLKGIRDRRAAGHVKPATPAVVVPPPASPNASTPTTANVMQSAQASAAKHDKEAGTAGDTTAASVWWDSEWIEAMQPRAYVPEDDKALFRRALRNDLAFLTASNVMDYSLLVGVSEALQSSSARKSDGGSGGGSSLPSVQPGFRVRIVDFLGAWTLVKQLESSGKKAIKSSAPTIIPPQEYANRFHQAVETYFVGCPATSNSQRSMKRET